MADETVRSVQDVLGAAGAPPEFVWRGKSYKMGFLTQAAQARFEELIIGAESATVSALKGRIPPDDYRDRLADLGRNVDLREYTAGGPLWQRYATGRDRDRGICLYLLALLREYQPELKETDVVAMLQEIPEFLHLVADRAVPGFFAYVAAGLKIPFATIEPMMLQAQSALRVPLTA